MKLMSKLYIEPSLFYNIHPEVWYTTVKTEKYNTYCKLKVFNLQVGCYINVCCFVVLRIAGDILLLTIRLKVLTEPRTKNLYPNFT